MYAVAILLRGSLVAPALVAVEVRLREKYGHSGILLSTGEIVEASALHNKVLVHHNPKPWWVYERQLALDHLGIEAQTEIARIAIAMKGWKYDWRNGRGHAFARQVWDDPRRVICYEHTALSTLKFLKYDLPVPKVTSADIREAWEGSLIAI